MKPVRESRNLDWGGEHLSAGMKPVHQRENKGSPFHTTLVSIKCVDCKKKHLIFTQDKHQVKRCKACQRRMRNARPKNKGAKHERVAKRRKKRRQARPEPAIPDFEHGQAGQSNTPKLII